jgi:hypothetical protein
MFTLLYYLWGIRVSIAKWPKLISIAHIFNAAIQTLSPRLIRIALAKQSKILSYHEETVDF